MAVTTIGMKPKGEKNNAEFLASKYLLAAQAQQKKVLIDAARALAEDAGDTDAAAELAKQDAKHEKIANMGKKAEKSE